MTEHKRKNKNKLVLFGIISAISLLRFMINLWLSKDLPPLPEEIEIIKISEYIKKEFEFNFKYSFFPFLIAPLTEIYWGDNLLISRAFSSLLGSISIFFSFVITKNMLLPVILAIQPMHVFISSLAKADILIFTFTLISIFSVVRIYQTRGDEISEEKYSKIAGICSSACIIFKYFFPTVLASFVSILLLSKSKRKSVKHFLIFFAIPTIFLFFPFFIMQSQNFLNSIKEQYELHTSYVLLGEKDLSSAIFSISTSITSLTAYSVFVFFPAIISVVWIKRNSIPYILYFFVSFISLYMTSPHLFPHYYYPISLPLMLLASGAFLHNPTITRKQKKITFLFIGVLVICVAKTKDLNFLWIDEIKNEIGDTRKSILLVLPKHHQFIEYVITHKLNLKVETFIYDLGINYYVDKSARKITDISKRYSFVILDKTQQKEKTQNNLAQIKDRIEQECRKKKEIDSFNVSELDKFEKFFFPYFKNILFHFKVEIWECSDKNE